MSRSVSPGQGRPGNPPTTAGFTMIELMIVLVISLVVFGGFSLSITDAVDVGVGGAGSADLQEVGRRTLDQIKRDMQSTGRFFDPTVGIMLPHVFSNGQPDPALQQFAHDTVFLANLAATFPAPPPWPTPANPPAFVAPGSEIEPFGIRECIFRLPTDNDNDGRIISSVNGDIEWNDNLFAYILLPNNQGTLDLVRRRMTPGNVITDELICRCVEALTFDSVETKNILPLNAVEVHLHLRRVTTRGQTQRLHLATTVAMRNSR